MKKTSTIFMLAFVCFLFMIPIICYVFKLPDISGFAVAATISGFFFAFADLLASESQIWKADMERCGIEASKMEDFLRRTLQIYGEMERKLESILAIAKHPTYNLEHQEYDDYEKLYSSVKRVQSSAYDLLYNKKGKEKNLNLSESQYKLTVRWSKVMLFVGIIALLSLLIIDSIAPIFEQSQSIYSIYGCAFILANYLLKDQVEDMVSKKREKHIERIKEIEGYVQQLAVAESSFQILDAAYEKKIKEILADFEV